MWYVFPVQYEELRINHLTLLLVVTMPCACVVLVAGNFNWGLQMTSSLSIWGCVLKGGYEEGIIWRAKLCLKGVEDFNLEHCTHTYWCGPLVNGEYQQGVTFRASSANEG